MVYCKKATGIPLWFTTEMFDDGLKLWYLLSDCVDELREAVVLSRHDAEVADFLSLTAGQLRLIQAVCRLTRGNPEGISLKTLADELHLSSSAVSLMVDTLVRKDDLERLHSSLDRRMVLIRISPRGRTAIDKVRQHYSNVMKNFMASMSEYEQERAGELFTKLLADIRDYPRQMTRDDDGTTG